MKQLPDSKVPKLGSEGANYREVQLQHQLPKQDLSLSHNQHISRSDQSYFQSFVVARNDIALDVGHAAVVLPKADLDCSNRSLSSTAADGPELAPTGGGSSSSTNCRKCKEVMRNGDLAVVAPRFALRDYWHPGCFSCTTCDEILVDLTYCVFDDNLYCERHYAENLKPRCGACDELIFAGQYTKVFSI